jgi:hypothetical protein
VCSLWRDVAAHFRGLDGVRHKHGDCEGADSAGDRSDRARDFGDRGVDVSHESEPLLGELFFAGGVAGEDLQKGFKVGNAIDADVDDGGTGTDHVRGDHCGLADGGDENLGATADFGEVLGTRVTNGYGGVRVSEEHCEGFAYYVAAADDDGFAAFDGNPAAAENLHAPCGRARDEAGAHCGEKADVQGMETVDVLGRIDCEKDALRLDLRREWKLDKNAVYVVALVKNGDDLQKFFGGDAGGESDLLAVESDLCGSFYFVADVNLGGGIVADENGGESRTDSTSGKYRNFGR